MSDISNDSLDQTLFICYLLSEGHPLCTRYYLQIAALHTLTRDPLKLDTCDQIATTRDPCQSQATVSKDMVDQWLARRFTIVDNGQTMAASELKRLDADDMAYYNENNQVWLKQMTIVRSPLIRF